MPPTKKILTFIASRLPVMRSLHNFGGSPPLLPRATTGTLPANRPGLTKYILVVNGMMLFVCL